MYGRYVCVIISYNKERLNGFSHTKFFFLLHCCYAFKFCIINFFFAEKIILNILNITTKLSFNISLCYQ